MIPCPACNTMVQPQTKFCTTCGSKVGGSVSMQAITPANAPGATILMSGPSPVPVTAVYLTISDGRQLPVQSVTSIGRDPHDNAIHINDGRMSRKHAQLEEQQGHWLLTDLGSSNGTLVNGRAITAPTPIRPGDQIQMGDTMLSLHIAGQSPAPAGWGMVPFTPAPMPMPAGTPEVIVPPGGWQSWPKPPHVEGRVEHIDRHTEKRDDLMQRGCVAIFLGMIAAPLAFLPFMQGSDLNVLDIRVVDAHSSRVVDVKVIGDLKGTISQGDIIAVWGKTQNGLYVLQRAYNYTTGHSIAVRK
jgi:hypothetical protein